jgi:hypothetical protein
MALGRFFAPLASAMLSAVAAEEHGQASGAATAIRELAVVLRFAVLPFRWTIALPAIRTDLGAQVTDLEWRRRRPPPHGAGPGTDRSPSAAGHQQHGEAEGGTRGVARGRMPDRLVPPCRRRAQDAYPGQHRVNDRRWHDRTRVGEHLAAAAPCGIGRRGDMNRQRSPMRQTGPRRHARLMKPQAPVPAAIAGTDTCSPDGCAQLCTEQGMAAAHAAYCARMLARARRIVVDPDLAEDVVQEAFLRAWRACSSFDPAGGPLVNWLLVYPAGRSNDLLGECPTKLAGSLAVSQRDWLTDRLAFFQGHHPRARARRPIRQAFQIRFKSQRIAVKPWISSNPRTSRGEAPIRCRVCLPLAGIGR